MKGSSFVLFCLSGQRMATDASAAVAAPVADVAAAAKPDGAPEHVGLFGDVAATSPHFFTPALYCALPPEPEPVAPPTPPPPKFNWRGDPEPEPELPPAPPADLVATELATLRQHVADVKSKLAQRDAAADAAWASHITMLDDAKAARAAQYTVADAAAAAAMDAAIEERDQAKRRLPVAPAAQRTGSGGEVGAAFGDRAAACARRIERAREVRPRWKGFFPPPGWNDAPPYEQYLARKADPGRSPPRIW